MQDAYYILSEFEACQGPAGRELLQLPVRVAPDYLAPYTFGLDQGEDTRGKPQRRHPPEIARGAQRPP